MRDKKKTLILYLISLGIFILILIFVIGYLLVYPVYSYHIWNYPLEKQIKDIGTIFKDKEILINNLTLLAEKPILRPYSQYFFGLFMVFQRTGGGNNAPGF